MNESKTIYFYGVMKASKTAQLLTMNYNYCKHNVKPFLLKTSIDTDSKGDYITSRLGLKAKADAIVDCTKDAHTEVERIKHMCKNSKVILVDEAQFLAPEFIKDLCLLCKVNGTDLYAFGLLKDYKGHLFAGAETWLEQADSIREIKTTCELCNKKATCNALEDSEGNLVPDTFESAVNIIHTGDEEYHVYCQYHMLRKLLGKDRKDKNDKE